MTSCFLWHFDMWGNVAILTSAAVSSNVPDNEACLEINLFHFPIKCDSHFTNYSGEISLDEILWCFYMATLVSLIDLWLHLDVWVNTKNNQQEDKGVGGREIIIKKDLLVETSFRLLNDTIFVIIIFI